MALGRKAPWVAITGWLPIPTHCDSACGVLGCRSEEATRRPRAGGGREGLKWALVGGLCPPSGGREVQWVKRGTESPFTLMEGKINLFLKLPCTNPQHYLHPLPNPPTGPQMTFPFHSPLPPLGILRGRFRLSCVLVQRRQPGGAHDRHPRITREVKPGIQGSPGHWEALIQPGQLNLSTKAR